MTILDDDYYEEEEGEKEKEKEMATENNPTSIGIKTWLTRLTRG